MNFKETGFRGLYHVFCVFPFTEHTKGLFKGKRTDANGFLTYGYVDVEAGLTLEVLATAWIENDQVKFADPNLKKRTFIRIGAVAEDSFFTIDDSNGELAKRYAEKIQVLSTYDVEEAVEKTRTMRFLDPLRDPEWIDDLQVILTKKGCQPESCWTRIIGLGDHCFIGTLLNEPYQNFGYHQGETIGFFVQENENQEVQCVSDMNPTMELTHADLEDGRMLEEAIAQFNKERNQDTLFTVLEILRDSNVYVPCTAILGNADQAKFDALFNHASDNPEVLIGEEFVTSEATRFVPDLLQNEEQLYFPVFTTEAAMGTYGDRYSKILQPMLEVISLARNNEQELSGIVVNAFGESFVLEPKLWDVVEKLKSRIVEE